LRLIMPMGIQFLYGEVIHTILDSASTSLVIGSTLFGSGIADGSNGTFSICGHFMGSLPRAQMGWIRSGAYSTMLRASYPVFARNQTRWRGIGIVGQAQLISPIISGRNEWCF